MPRAAESVKKTSPLFEIALVLVRLDYVASFIVNTAERSARNSESEVNSNSEREFGQAGPA
jgi:hypothetical protein